MSDTWQSVGRVADLPEGASKKIQLGDACVAVFHIEGQFFAISEMCPHRGGPLSEGHVKNFQVSCPWHAASFDLRTGQAISGPGRRNLQSYPIQINAGEIYLKAAKAFEK